MRHSVHASILRHYGPFFLSFFSYKKSYKAMMLSQSVSTGKNSIIPIKKRQGNDKFNTPGYKLAFWSR